MKFYIVSEDELERLKVASFKEFEHQYLGYDLNDELEEAKAACRQRPVPDWATHFYGPATEETVDMPMAHMQEIQK